MDISTHSTASSSGGGNNNNNLPAAAAQPQQPQQPQQQTRKPPMSREQSQLAKLKDANAKYKNLLKLAKERIQEQEGVLDDRRCKFNSYFVSLKLCKFLFEKLSILETYGTILAIGCSLLVLKC